MLLDKNAQDALAQAISEQEARTDAEMVTVLARQADDYRYGGRDGLNTAWPHTLWAQRDELGSPSKQHDREAQDPDANLELPQLPRASKRIGNQQVLKPWL